MSPGPSSPVGVTPTAGQSRTASPTRDARPSTAGQWVQSNPVKDAPHFGNGETGIRGFILDKKTMYLNQLSAAAGSRAEHLKALTVVLSFPPKVSLEDLDLDERIRACLQDIHQHYAKLSRAPPSQDFSGLSDMYTNIQYSALLRFLRDFGIGKFLVSKAEVFELFRFSSDGSRTLNLEQFQTFVYNMSRVAFSRPPHLVPVEHCLRHFYTNVLTETYRNNLGYLGSSAAIFGAPTVSPVKSKSVSPAKAVKASPNKSTASPAPTFLTPSNGYPSFEPYKPMARVGGSLAKKLGVEAEKPRASLLKPAKE